MNRVAISKEKLAAFFVGLFSPYTVSLVGEMPVGEVVLLVVLGWMALYLVLQHRMPSRVLEDPLLRCMLICDGVALLGYMLSDLAWDSRTHDEIRGWARIVFLGIDLVTLAYLFEQEGRNALNWLLWGEVIGGAIQPILIRPLFGDFWKFGFGGPLSLGVLLLLPRLGFSLGLLVTLGLSALHFAMNFRSMGGLFMLLGVLVVLQRVPVKQRLICIPVLGILTAAGLAFIAARSETANRAHDLRSNISRTAMLTAAWNGIKAHPFVGNGSWLGRSGVIADFLSIRYETAQLEHLGGIGRDAIPEDEEQPYAIHSQLLVALAEGGILGGTFFLLYGVLLVTALVYYIVFRAWSPHSALYLYLLLNALFNLLMSPFSGVHRVYIATAAGLLLLIRAEYLRERASAPASVPTPAWKVPLRAAGAVQPWRKPVHRRASA